MKKLPIGIQELSKIIESESIYVDKTKHLLNLINSGSYYFVSRPRRFGKSLFINTLKEIFSGNKELFNGLWIFDKIEWKQNPIIHLDFSKIYDKKRPLDESIKLKIAEIFNEKNITPKGTTEKELFQELISYYSENGKKVVILIDEYDKPIIDVIEDIEKAKENRETLKNFYSVVKGNDDKIKFFLITGVSKFSQVSIFSDLNNLLDITTADHYANLFGITQQELEFYFEEHINELSKKLKIEISELLLEIKRWYNGYSWNGQDFVYNPFSILNLFQVQSFENYWFQTGTPTFLLKLIKKNNYTIFDIEKKHINKDIFNKFNVENIEVNSLLFQTGYLTIKSHDYRTGYSLLDFPNHEVEQSLTNHLLAEFSQRSNEQNSSILFSLMESLKEDNLDDFQYYMEQIFHQLTYPNIEDKEKYYHSIFYLVIKLLGFQIESEVVTKRGRIDTALKTDSHIYIIEFKLNSAEQALQQIKDKKYYQKYLVENKPIWLIGIGFDTETRSISDWKMEELKNCQ